LGFKNVKSVSIDHSGDGYGDKSTGDTQPRKPMGEVPELSTCPCPHQFELTSEISILQICHRLKL